MRILIMHAGWQAGLACIQSLGRRGHRIEILDQDPASPHRESAYVSRIVPAPYPDCSAAHDTHVEHLATSDDYDLIIPITDADARLLSRIRERHPHLRNIVVSTRDAVETADNKATATRLASRMNIDVPDSWYPADMPAVRALLPALAYPSVVKLPFGSGGDGVFVVGSEEALLERMRRAFADGHRPFIQRYVHGEQRNVMIMADHGTVIDAFTCAIERRHYVGGTPPFATSITDGRLIDIVRRLVAALEWHGAMDIDFQCTPDGTPYFLEMNPRLSGNAIFAGKLGIDMPARYVDLVKGVATAPPPSFDVPGGRTFCALSESEIRWILRNPRRRLREALGRHLSWKSCTNIFWSDWPLLRAHWRHIRALIRDGA